jgi:predicted ferric reductase
MVRSGVSGSPYSRLSGCPPTFSGVFVRDGSSRGYEYRVVSPEHRGAISSLEMAPVGEPLDYQPGQFVFLEIDEPGMREPHAFTIGSGSDLGICTSSSDTSP